MISRQHSSSLVGKEGKNIQLPIKYSVYLLGSNLFRKVIISLYMRNFAKLDKILEKWVLEFDTRQLYFLEDLNIPTSERSADINCSDFLLSKANPIQVVGTGSVVTRLKYLLCML